MKRSQLVQLIKEELRGYSPQIGQTKGGTPDELSKILTTIAKRPANEPNKQELTAQQAIELIKANPTTYVTIKLPGQTGSTQYWPDDSPVKTLKHRDAIAQLAKATGKFERSDIDNPKYIKLYSVQTQQQKDAETAAVRHAGRLD